MHRTRAAAALLASSLLVGCGDRVAAPASPSRADEQKAVYEAVLSGMYARPGVQRFVIRPERTPADPDAEALAKAGLRPIPLIQHFPELGADTAADFEAAFEPGRIPADLKTVALVEWLDDAGWEALVTRPPKAVEDDLDAHWEAFHRAFPQSAGWISFSRVGLSKDATQALVAVSSTRGGLDGSGHLVFLQKVKGVWRVQKTVMLWIS